MLDTMTPKTNRLSFYSESILGSIEPSELEPNMKNLYIFMFMMALSGATQGYTDYSNQAAALYNVQYQWTEPHQISVH